MAEQQYFLIPDTETGGLDSKKHKLCEIGATVFDNSGKKVDEFHALLNPKEDSKMQTLYAMKINRCYKRYGPQTNQLSNQDVADHFVRWLLDMSEKYSPVLAGQNLQFDIRFISEFLEAHGYENWNEIFGFHHLDTTMLAKALQLSGLLKTKKLNLGALAEEFKIINPDAHTAIADCETTALVLINMLNLIKK